MGGFQFTTTPPSFAPRLALGWYVAVFYRETPAWCSYISSGSRGGDPNGTQPITILIPADRINEEQEIISRIKNGDIVEHFETVRICKNGANVHLSLTISPIKDIWGNITGASKTARNITKRKLTQLAIEESEIRYKYLFNNNPAYIIIWNLKTLTVEEVNDPVIEKYGYSREEGL